MKAVNIAMLLAFGLACGMLFGAATPTADAAKVYTITNDTGAAADDLHIEWDHGVTISPDPVPPFNTLSGNKTATIDMSGGAGEGAGNNVVFTASTTGSGPDINSGWWTDGGVNVGNLDAGNTNPWP